MHPLARIRVEGEVCLDEEEINQFSQDCRVIPRRSTRKGQASIRPCDRHATALALEGCEGGMEARSANADGTGPAHGT